MKLLFDQNISPKILKILLEEFPLSTHVRFEKLEDSSDSTIFSYARENHFTIVTFDSDFVSLGTLRGYPPKIIWLNTGNLTTKFIAQLLSYHSKTILSFIDSRDKAVLEIRTKDYNFL